MQSLEPVTNRSWPRIRIVHICARSFKNLERKHRKRTLDADNVYAEQSYRTVLART